MKSLWALFYFVALCAVQLAVAFGLVALVVALFFLPADGIWLFALAPLGFGLVSALLAISAVWAYRDSRRLIERGADAWIPRGWAWVMVAAWFPGLSAYLTMRKFYYLPQIGRAAATVSPKEG